MKKIAIVAAHFPPSNLAAVHRARLWAQHLPEFGWEPIIITTHWDYYEETLDWELYALLPEQLQVIRTHALKTKPLRFVGDIGIRGFFWHYQALAHLAKNKEIDFIHITIPSNFSALLGRLIYQKYKIPYGIDYIDPWVHVWPGSEKIFSKAWFSRQLANLLEPWSVKYAQLITGISLGYYEDVLKRNPHLEKQAVHAFMPYGGSEQDFIKIRANPKKTFLFDTNDGNYHLIYAGAMLPKGYVILEQLFKALKHLLKNNPETIKRLRLHFVGTGKSPTDPKGYNIKPYIEKYQLADYVDENPQRIGYIDVLSHLIQANGILIIGSTEKHYSPSKLFQGVLAKKPIFALLHQESSAIQILDKSNAGSYLSLTENNLPDENAIAEKLKVFIQNNPYDVRKVRWELFENYSARETTKILIETIEKVINRKS